MPKTKCKTIRTSRNGVNCVWFSLHSFVRMRLYVWHYVRKETANNGVNEPTADSSSNNTAIIAVTATTACCNNSERMAPAACVLALPVQQLLSVCLPCFCPICPCSLGEEVVLVCWWYIRTVIHIPIYRYLYTTYGLLLYMGGVVVAYCLSILFLSSVADYCQRVVITIIIIMNHDAWLDVSGDDHDFSV